MQNELRVQQISTHPTTSRVLHNPPIQTPTPRPSDTPEAKRTEQTNHRAEGVPPTPAQSQKPSIDSNQEIDRSQLEEALNLLNESASIINARYSFQVNSETDQLFVQVKDRRGEVVRQEPPEAIINVASKIGKMIGTFLNEIA